MEQPPYQVTLFLKKCKRHNLSHGSSRLLGFESRSAVDQRALSQSFLTSASKFSAPESSPSIAVVDFGEEKPGVDPKTGVENHLSPTGYIRTAISQGSAGQTNPELKETTSDSSSFESSDFETDNEQDKDESETTSEANLNARLHPIKVGVEEIKRLESKSGTSKREISETATTSGQGRVQTGAGSKAKRAKTKFWLM